MVIDEKLLKSARVSPQAFLLVDESGNPVFMKELAILVERIEKALEKLDYCREKTT